MESSPQSPTSNQRRAILGTVLLVFLLLAAMPITYLLQHFVLRHLPTLFVRPLESAVVDDLCTVLELEGDDRCQEEQVYPHEFFPALRAHYGRGTAMEQVEKELGKYRQACGEWLNRGENGDFLDCRYSLEGDRDFVLYLAFQKETDANEQTASVWRSCSLDVRNGSLWDIYACQPALNSGLLLVLSDNTFLIGRGFAAILLLVDVVLLALLVRLWR